VTVNLEPIKAQLAKDIGGYICLHRDDMADLVAEVERLRAEADLLRTGLDATRAYAVSVEAEVLSLRGERAAVVAYLRKQANAPHPIERGVPSLSPAGRGLLLFHADRIERGEHRREEGG
jgi:hypothetical protein